LTTPTSIDSLQSSVILIKPTFDQVYNDTFRFVWRIIKKQCIHDSSVDDLVQEVFIAVYKQLPQFECKSVVKTWVYGIIKNVMHNYRRVNRRKGSSRAINCDVVDPNDLISNNIDQFEIAKRLQAKLILNDIISKMDSDKAEVFVLHELEDMSIAEISELIKVNINTVYSRLRFSRKQFESLFKSI